MKKKYETLWQVYDKVITSIDIIDIKQTGIKYPDTALFRYSLSDKKSVIIEDGKTSVTVGKKFFTINEDEAIKKSKK